MSGGAFLTPQRRIRVPGGDVLHAMRAGDAGFSGFGEAYLSLVGSGAVKGWRRHNRMVMNLVVVSGEVRFAIVDDREPTPAMTYFQLSPNREETHARLTVPPGLWTAFQGAGRRESVVLNLANLPHDPTEADTRPLDAFDLAWTGEARP